jgi:RNA polymerase sigma factor (sigma-70 family)
MADKTLDNVLEHIHRLVGAEEATPQADRELLDRFLHRRDERAFSALVQRHGPMVLGTCRRLLRSPHDAEDACQAVFLVLVRKADSIRNRESVGSWLHTVACRVAGRLRQQNARRRAREAPIEDVPTEGADPSWREVHALLDAELHRLPDKFQAPLLLCYLEGKTRDEAAQVLGLALGALRSRLERGRELLRRRLARRGLTLSAAVSAALLSQQAAPAALPPLLELALVKLVQAGAAISERVAALAAGSLNALGMTKMKHLAAVLLLLGALTSGAALTWGGARTGPPPEDDNAPAAARHQAPDKDLNPSAKASAREDDQTSSDARAASRWKLKQIALAMLNYHDCYASGFPPPAIYAGGPRAPLRGAFEGARPMGAGGGIGTPPGGGGGFGGFGGTPGGGFGGMAGGPPGAGPAGAGGGASPLPGASAAGGPPGGMVGGRPGMGPKGGGAGGDTKAAALLSWRVALLPFLEEDELYKQFRLDEPWDGPHNKKLLHKMPKVFAHPKGIGAEAGMTYYQVFVGEHAAFEKHRGMRLPSDFPDGLSNTILIVEGGTPVPWTKPEDLHYDADEPLPSVGGAFRDVFHTAMADGTVHTFEKTIPPEKLRLLITRDDGQPIDLASLEVPASPRARQLHEDNRKLRVDLDNTRKMVEDLKHQLRDLQKERDVLTEEDVETDRLRGENEQLRQAGRKLVEQAERLKKEVEALRREIDRRRHRPDRRE